MDGICWRLKCKSDNPVACFSPACGHVGIRCRVLEAGLLCAQKRLDLQACVWTFQLKKKCTDWGSARVKQKNCWIFYVHRRAVCTAFILLFLIRGMRHSVRLLALTRNQSTESSAEQGYAHTPYTTLVGECSADCLLATALLFSPVKQRLLHQSVPFESWGYGSFPWNCISLKLECCVKCSSSSFFFFFFVETTLLFPFGWLFVAGSTVNPKRWTLFK